MGREALFMVGAGGKADRFAALLGADIAGHDKDGMARIYHTAARIAQAAFIEDLQERYRRLPGAAFSTSSNRTTL